MPVAPLILPRYSWPAMRRVWRVRRCTNTAISLPSVVGVAGWPCVRESMGVSAASAAIAETVATAARAAGSQTCSTASRTPTA